MAWLPWRRSRQSEIGYPLTSFRRGMQRMMDDLFGGRWVAPWWGEPSWAPALDLRETESDVVLEMEAPGLKPDELDVSITDNTLTIRGERKSECQEKEGEYHLSERCFGSFCRVVSLPGAVDAEKATAKYEGGLVTVTLPKTEESRTKKIEVKT